MKKAFNLGLFLGLLSVTSLALQSCNEGGSKKTDSVTIGPVDSIDDIDDLNKDTVEKEIKKDTIAVKGKRVFFIMKLIRRNY